MKQIQAAYHRAKSAKVGDTCVCPSCNRTFVKTNYQQAFCKNLPGTRCKDRYWNIVDPKKRNNTTRISPANAAYMTKKELERERWEERNHAWYFDDDPGWDAHKGTF